MLNAHMDTVGVAGMQDPHQPRMKAIVSTGAGPSI